MVRAFSFSQWLFLFQSYLITLLFILFTILTLWTRPQFPITSLMLELQYCTIRWTKHIIQGRDYPVTNTVVSSLNSMSFFLLSSSSSSFFFFFLLLVSHTRKRLPRGILIFFSGLSYELPSVFEISFLSFPFRFYLSPWFLSNYRMVTYGDSYYRNVTYSL